MELKKLANALKALGDPTRLKMIALLNARDCCVCELVPIFNISQPAISRHMSRLKAEGLVNEQRKGQWVFYSLNREQLEAIGFALANLPDVTEEFKALEEKGLLVCCTES
ncbi:ArsR/SmtB family transcription factor [Brevibacillus ginsengisoli]|uniref:ArsR/SmtB family transcription factor n=1 Tax=Brevibacillus ginsengisoli TaxID=363854 RepID=UPI003CE6A269